MRRAAALLAIALGACSAAPPAPLESRADEVIGGSYSLGDPAVVALTSAAGNVICSGALISPRVVLTAGHCTYKLFAPFAYFGRSTPYDVGTPVSIARWIHHPDYTTANFRYADIGVVVLSYPVTDVRPLAWNAAPLGPEFVGRTVRVVGFGFQQPASAEARRIGDKMTLRVPVLQLVEGKEYEYVMGTCNGDSGGPQLFEDDDGAERIVGVTSYGRGGCTGNSGAHRVDLYDGWIREQIALYDPPSCGKDWRCVAGCTAGADPDCPCAPDDGFCSADCQDPGSDPDCPAACAAEGTCLTTCPAPDADCGDPCGAEGHCLEDCAARDPDCPAPVGEGEACASSFDCAAGTVCLTPRPGEDAVCTPTCAGGGDCEGGRECRRVSAAGGDGGACLPPLELIEGFDGAGNCSTSPGSARGIGWGLGLALGSVLVMLRRGRRARRLG